jgi:putative oxidoreductase
MSSLVRLALHRAQPVITLLEALQPPVLLALGLFGRFAALGLFVVNAVAVISLVDIPPAALQQHQFWGCLLLGLLLWGPGRWSLDAWLTWRLQGSPTMRE